jgi:pimeloyl-ACP methyl ester carboxylesterase
VKRGLAPAGAQNGTPQPVKSTPFAGVRLSSPPHPARSRRFWSIGLTLGLLSLLLLNILGYNHAGGLVRWDPNAGTRPEIENLGPADIARMAVFGVRLPRPVHRSQPADHGFTQHEVVEIPNPGGPLLRAFWLPSETPRGVFVALHGYGGAADQVLPVARFAAARGWSVLVPDFRGSGASEGDTTTLGREEATDARQVLDWARHQGPGPVVVYGFSMGAAAAVGAVARAGATPDALILDGCYGHLTETTAARVRSVGLPGRPIADWLVVLGGLSARTDAWNQAPREDAHHVRQPMLVLNGEADWRAPPEDGKSIAAAAGSQARFVLIPGAPHRIALDSPVWQHEIHNFLEHIVAREPDSP